MRKPIPRKRSKPRRGRIIDLDFLAFMGQRPCLVTGRSPVTLHHVRRNGEPKSDRRVIPLVAELHLIQFDPKQNQSIEALGKKKFEALHNVCLETAITLYNAAYAARSAALLHPPSHQPGAED